MLIRRKVQQLFLAMIILTTMACACGQVNREHDAGITPTPDTAAPDAAQTKTDRSVDTPPTLTDHVMGYERRKIPIELVLIPGDPTKGIKPFYIGKTEVTRDMFLRWSYGDDLVDRSSQHYAQLIGKDLRPTPMFEEFYALHIGRSEDNWLSYPALGMSWRTAQSYCLWLSEQTGRTYRLPTDAEWMHVLRLSGGVPAERETLLSRAVLKDNAPLDIYIAEIARPVASGKPDKLGLYDLLGNAAEWVQPQDDKRWVRGGHFMLKADELTEDWHAVENQEVWNATYPQIPVSRYWYIDFYVTGIRLVCEIDAPKQ